MRSTFPDLDQRLTSRGISRRQFLSFCGMLTATLALPASYTPRIARAVANSPRPPMIWLAFQDCTGDSESFLRSYDPGVADLVFDTVALNYHETLMVPSGDLAERSLYDTVTNYRGQYICVVEGSIPTRDGGVYCTIGGKTALSIAETVARDALICIAAGSCGWDGGLAAANPNPTGAVGLQEAVPGLTNLLNMPGCPVNGVNLVAALVHYLTFKQLPPTDASHRPLFAYGNRIHSKCERRKFYEADLFVREWGDEGHRKGWCLKDMGCRGPSTKSNCYTANWNENTSWPIRAGHGCIGCVNPNFWDTMTPLYRPD